MVGESGSVLDRFQPFVGGVYAGNFHCQVGKPAVRRGAVPVLHLRGDLHHVAGMELPGGLPPLLVIAPAGGAQQDLPAVVVDVPVVSAPWLEVTLETETPPSLLRG